jgi:hypothetical protein
VTIRIDIRQAELDRGMSSAWAIGASETDEVRSTKVALSLAPWIDEYPRVGYVCMAPADDVRLRGAKVISVRHAPDP